jgi:Mce-associated membrane protein
MATELCDDEVTADVPEQDGEHTEGQTGPRPPRRRAARAAAVALSVAALGTLAFLSWQYKQHRDVTDASEAALASAQTYATTLTSIDTHSVDDNFAKVVDGATGEFKDMYAQSAAQLRQVLIDNKAMSKGVVVDSAVKSAAKNRVEVLLFIDQAITNAASPAPRLDRSRVAMTMERVDGRWLASRVELK